MKYRLALIAAAAILLAAPTLAQVAPDAAVADATRPAKDIEKDASRKPVEMVAFAKVRPGDSVMDVWTASGYWARLFSKVVGPKGHVYAYVPEETLSFIKNGMDVAKAMAAEPGRENIMAVSDPLAAQPPKEFLNSLNVVWVFENYHDFHDPFMKGADVDAYNRAVFSALKPGGYYVIVDHAAPAGSGLAHTNDTHRIDPVTLRAEVEKAGFKFDAESKVLANPDDPRDKGVFDPSIRGKTDRFAYRFVKPRA